MKVHCFSYRYAVQILQHQDYKAAWDEIEGAFEQAPLFVWPGKSSKVKRLDVVQQLMNTYFDRVLAVDLGWNYHPLATKIEGSNLKADFRKRFGDLTVQVEVQFGNMARWYTDLFKFQAGYSAKEIQLGVSVIPMYVLATRIDQNVANFERAARELPSAELSITLPIVMFGVAPDEHTVVVDASTSSFAHPKDLTGRGNELNRWRIIHGHLSGTPMPSISSSSATGPLPKLADANRGIDEDEEPNPKWCG